MGQIPYVMGKILYVMGQIKHDCYEQNYSIELHGFDWFDSLSLP